MATKTDKKNAIRQEIMDSAVIYSSDLAGKTFLYVYGNDFFEVSFPVDHFLHLTGVETRLSAKDYHQNRKVTVYALIQTRTHHLLTNHVNRLLTHLHR